MFVFTTIRARIYLYLFYNKNYGTPLGFYPISGGYLLKICNPYLIRQVNLKRLVLCFNAFFLNKSLLHHSASKSKEIVLWHFLLKKCHYCKSRGKSNEVVFIAFLKKNFIHVSPFSKLTQFI